MMGRHGLSVMIPVCACSYLVFGFWYLIYVLVSCPVSRVLFFHALLCLLSFKFLFCSPLCQLYGFLHVFSCAPPPRYLTWPHLASSLLTCSLSDHQCLCIYSVSVFPSLPVRSLFVFCPWLFMLLFPVW